MSGWNAGKFLYPSIQYFRARGLDEISSCLGLNVRKISKIIGKESAGVLSSAQSGPNQTAENGLQVVTNGRPVFAGTESMPRSTGSRPALGSREIKVNHAP